MNSGGHFPIYSVGTKLFSGCAVYVLLVLSPESDIGPCLYLLTGISALFINYLLLYSHTGDSAKETGSETSYNVDHRESGNTKNV